jgi:MFS family permease
MRLSPKVSQIFPILLVNFIGTLGYSIILPFLVVLVLNLGGNELVYGILGATYSFFQLIGAPVLGSLSDKYGRKKILLVSQAGTLVGWIIFLIALYLPHVPLMTVQSKTGSLFVLNLPLFLIFLARCVDGITGGNISVANAYLADISSKGDRKKNFGKMAASANMGLIFGPVLAGVLGATSWGNILPVMAAAVISFVAIFVISIGLKDVNAKRVDEPLSAGKTNKLLGHEQKDCYTNEHKTDLHTILAIPNVLFMLGVYFLIFLAFNFYYVAFPVWAAQHLHWNVLRLGIFFSFLSAVLVVVQGPVLSKISAKISDAKLVIGGSLILAVAFVFFRSDKDIYIYFGALLFGLGNGVMWPSFLAILSNIGPDRYQGAIQGFASSAGSLASIIGLINGALLFNQFQENVFLLTTFFMLLIAVCSIRLLSFKN